MLYEMSCGTTPFVGEPAQLLSQHARRDAGRPGGIPDALWELIASMTSKQPDMRPPHRFRRTAPGRYAVCARGAACGSKTCGAAPVNGLNGPLRLGRAVVDGSGDSADDAFWLELLHGSRARGTEYAGRAVRQCSEPHFGRWGRFGGWRRRCSRDSERSCHARRQRGLAGGLLSSAGFSKRGLCVGRSCCWYA